MGLALVALVACSSDGSDDPPVVASDSSSSVISSSSSGTSSNSNSDESSSSNGDNSSSSSVISSSSSSSSTGTSSNSSDGWPFTSDGETLTPSKGLAELGLENVIKIEYKNGSAPVITDKPSEITIDVTDENVVVTIPNTSAVEYNFVLSGTTTNGSLKFYGDVRKGLYLNGVNITNNSGPAINIQKSGRINVHLVNGTQNFLTDGTNYDIPTGEQAKGAFFSEGKLEFNGSGTLTVKGKYNHAIAVDNDFEINNGKIIISEAAGDGIHANNKIRVNAGILDITSVGDAIQNEKNEKQDSIRVSGGKIKAKTTGPKSHGLVSESPIAISGNAIVQISVLGNGSKGIKSRDWVEFKGGKTSIKTSGTKHVEGDEDSSPAGIKLDKDLFIEGGELTIQSKDNEAKGINAAQNATISKGDVTIEAGDNAIKVVGELNITGGTVYVKSARKKAIEAGSYNKKVDVTEVNGGGF